MSNIELDRIDYDILEALQKNARLSNKELAARVGLAPSSCLGRTRRLQARGAFRGFHAEVEPSALGIEIEAMIAVRLRQHTRRRVDAFQDYVLSLAEVVALYHVAGENDFLIHVAARNTRHLREIILDAFTTRSEVAHLETALVFGHRRRPSLPNYRESPNTSGSTTS
jgi:DNA-binding Lrp family transcriptional regulator